MPFVGADAGEGLFGAEPEGALVAALVGALEEALDALQGEGLVEIAQLDALVEALDGGSALILDLLGDPGVQGEASLGGDAAGAAHGGGGEGVDLFLVDEPLDGFARLDDPC